MSPSDPSEWSGDEDEDIRYSQNVGVDFLAGSSGGPSGSSGGPLVDVKEEGVVGEKELETEDGAEEAEIEGVTLRRDLCDAEWLAIKVQDMMDEDDRQIEKETQMAMPVDDEVDEELAAEIADAVAAPAAALS
jgi:hypothetical protein